MGPGLVQLVTNVRPRLVLPRERRNVVNKCKVHGRRFCWICLGTTLGFPIEHALWEKVPGFKHAMAWVLGG